MRAKPAARPAQHLGARRAGCRRGPSRSAHGARAPGASVVARRRGACGRGPASAPRRRASRRSAALGIDVGVAAGARAACVGRSARAARRPIARRAAQRQRAGTRAATPGLRTMRAEALVGDVVEAQRVAVREQHALAEGDEHASGRRRRSDAAVASSSASPTRKSRLPAMKATAALARRPRRSTSAQRASKPRSAHVVADPDLEQVAEDEHRVGVGVAQVRGPGLEGAAACSRRGAGREMKSIARQPRRGDGRRRPRAARQRAAPTLPCAAHAARATSGDDGRARDRHVVERHVVVAAAVAGAHLLDRVDDVAARRRPCRTPRSPSPAASPT